MVLTSLKKFHSYKIKNEIKKFFYQNIFSVKILLLIPQNIPDSNNNFFENFNVFIFREQLKKF